MNQNAIKIAIISTRGIPNNYGGFEQFAEYLSVGLVQKGHQVTVYSPHFHPFKEKTYKGVNIKHIYSPEKWMGSSIGSFFYDFYSLLNALKKNNFDIVYIAGYTSIAPAFLYFNIKKRHYPVFVTNMDGLEWKRSKFNQLVQRFIHWEEAIAASHSKYLIADNKGIQDYYLQKYNTKSHFIPYGAIVYNNFSPDHIKEYQLKENSYYLIIARLEPENNIEMIITGFLESIRKDNFPLVIIGNLNTPHAKYLLKKYQSNKDVVFLGGIYEFEKLNSIRHYSNLYFHGHSVGGTNPSLLEAMASKCIIACHDNPFNRTVIGDSALYFLSKSDISSILSNETSVAQREFMRLENITRIKEEYSWSEIIKQYELFFKSILFSNKESRINSSKNIKNK